jgi:hypothetical protein
VNIEKLLKEQKIPYNNISLNEKYQEKSKNTESTILIADSLTYRKVAKEIAGRMVYNYLKDNKPKYRPVYICKALFVNYMNEHRNSKKLWKKTDALIFDGADEYNSKWDFQNITNLITYRLYNNLLTILIVTDEFEERIKEYNGNSFLSYIESMNRIEVR